MLANVLKEQKEYFLGGSTRAYRSRMTAIHKLEKAIRANEMKFYKAFLDDFGKSSFEVYMTEMGRIYKCFRDIKKNLADWMSVEQVKTPFNMLPAKSFIMKDPYGSVLIIAPNNYPLALAIEPLIMAIAAGNTACLKLAEATVRVSNLIEEIISSTFDRKFVYVIRGAVKETEEAIHLPFDKIFFTGSTRVGKLVMRAASNHLTPIALELGGKSPAIVGKSANLSLSAKRIARGKLINCGQTCIAPDYVLVHKSVKDRFINELKKAFISFYGTDPQNNEEFTKMINTDYTHRMKRLLEETSGETVFGGRVDMSSSYVAPTIVDKVDWEDTLMKEEIFGPILPIITFDDIDVEISRLGKMDKALSLYIFSRSRKEIMKILKTISFGGGMVNDTLLHFANDNLPFGGVGASGMGKSHGKWGFDEFVHKKAIVKRPSIFQIDFLKPPYRNRHKLLKFFYR